jgi:DNA helicase II / ATP-dependent DNA helicase PcrA
VSLSVEQAVVVASIDRHNLVLALPGAGKTYTMTSFISNVVQNIENKVIALTFTKAASDEMKSRLGKLVRGRQRKQIFISTFHSLIWSQTKSHPDFSGRKLITGPASERVSRHIIESYRLLNGYDVEFTVDREVTHDKAGIELDKPKLVKSKVSFSRVCLMLLNQLSMTPYHEDFDFEFGHIFFSGTQHFYHYYLSQLTELRYWPMDIMCVEITRALLVGDIAPINCTHIIVDEYQDTDLVQYAWLKSHGIAGTKITVVGDDDQAVYSFRGAMGVAGMQMFQNDFNVKSHTLSMCFRCGREILNSAGSLVEFNEKRIKKTMNSATEYEGQVFLLEATTKDEEAESMVDMVSRNQGKSIAILARTNAELDDLEAYLQSRNIDCIRINSSSIWDNDNLILWLHFICVITQVNSGNHITPLLVYLRESQSNILMINKFLDGLGFGHSEIHELEVLPATGYLHELCQQYWHLASTEDSETIIALVDEIQGRFEGVFTKGMREFKTTFSSIFTRVNGKTLRDKAIEMERLTKKTNKKEATEEKLVLTTFHGSKGLEWEVVWLAGLDNENIPHKMPGVSMTPAVVEEERRLLYVGMTRAKLRLYLSWVNLPSKFIAQTFY